MKKERNSNIELLRIISIIMIVVSHYCIHGVGINSIYTLELGLNRFLLEAFMLGNLGSILFVTISGYYLINSSGFKIQKLLRIIFQIMFYSVFIYCFLCILHFETFQTKTFLKCLLPITFKQYWFATTYVLLYIFHPFINKFLNNITRKEHFFFLGIMIVIFSILSTCTTQDYYGNELIQFLLFYSIGAYLYKYPKNILNKNAHLIIIISSLLIIVSIIALDILSLYHSVFIKHSVYFLNRTSTLTILLATALFEFFAKKKFFSSSIINLTSSMIFGVYLISDNHFLRVIIWNDIFKNLDYVTSPYLFLHMITATVLTIMACLLIELVRKFIFEKGLFILLDNKLITLQNKFQTFINSKIKFN